MSGSGSGNGPTPAGAKQLDDGFDRTWAAAPPTDVSVDTDEPADLETNEERYTTHALIGRGGMGEVQLCADERTGRQVAMKIIRAGHGNTATVRQRFLREARVQAQLEHPSIVPVYDLGKRPDGEMYFTMKRVRGRTLNEIVIALREGSGDPAFSRRRLLGAFGQVCLAVDFAHKRGVLHRDLKPANIMLGEYGEVYVLDWGLAKVGDAEEMNEGIVAGATETMDADATAVGAVLGTPGYIAPEQLGGTSDPGSDVYALGAILFELLTLERFHVGDGAAELLASTLDGRPGRAAERRPELDLPPELDELCHRATALDPVDRIGSARELYEDIERYLDGDRNVSLRLEYADKAEEDATALTRQAVEGHDAMRVSALQAIGRTLALDPGRRGALGLLGQLLSSPPSTLPDEAARAIRKAELEQVRLDARHGAIGLASWVLYLPLILWLGLRDTASLAISTMLILAAAGLAYKVSLPQTHPRLRWAAILVGTVALASLYRIFGAFVCLPTIMLGHVIAYGTSPDVRMRWAAAIAGTLALCGAAAADIWGLLGDPMTSSAGSISVVPGLTSFPAGTTLIVLLASSVALMLTPAFILGRTRDQLTRALRRIELQAWQFRQMVSESEPGSA